MNLGKFVVFIGVCLLGRYTASDSKHAPQVKGLWVNELGSEMAIKRTHRNVFFGKYCTGVGSGPIEPDANVVGSIGNINPIEKNNSSYSTTIGFTVTFITKNKKYPYSTATWSGLYHAERGVKTKIYTTWINIRNINNIKDLWGATRIGKDTFEKVNRKPKLCQ